MKRNLATRTRRSGRLVVWVAAATAAMMVAAGCTSDGSDDDDPPSAGSKKSGLIIQVNGGVVSPFYIAVKQGSDDAAKALGVDYEYVAPSDMKNFVPDYSTLIKQSIARNPDALIIGDYVPDAFDPLIKEAVAKGIPVLVANAGLDQWEDLGAIGFVGESAEDGGAAAGDEMVGAGVTSLLCVNASPANPAMQVRCSGAGGVVADAGGSWDELDIPLADQNNSAAIQTAIEGYVRSHPDTDGIYVAASSPTPAVAAVEALGKTGDIQVGSADIWAGQLEAIKNGDILFAINQQPYLQGWYSILIADQYAKYELKPTAPINTGGLAINKDNVDTFLAVNEENPNILGPAG